MNVVTRSLKSKLPKNAPTTVAVTLPSVGDVLGLTCDTDIARCVITMTTQSVALRFPNAKVLLSVARKQNICEPMSLGHAVCHWKRADAVVPVELRVTWAARDAPKGMYGTYEIATD